MKSALSEPHFHNEEAAFAYVEARLWPTGPVCEHCGCTDRIGRLKGKTTRAGLYKCYACRKPFTVRMGTVFESRHVPLRYWLQAIYLMASSKKGISTRQLQRTFGGSMTTSWFLSNRIREAIKTLGVEPPIGGEGGIVETDETFIGKKPDTKVQRGYSYKRAVMSLVQRRPEGARIRSFHVSGASAAVLPPVIKVQVSLAAHVMTDEACQYAHSAKNFAAHDFTTHSGVNTCRMGSSTPTPLKDITLFSSAGWLASTSIVQSIICTATWPRPTSDITTGSSWSLTTNSGPT